MSLFACAGCGCVENSACCNYWSRKIDKLPLLCSECDPDIKVWHGRFAKRAAEGMHVDQSGGLWSSGQIAAGALPSHYTIVGTVPPQEVSTPSQVTVT
jgi:hypothetical protein